jgi:PIN domain
VILLDTNQLLGKPPGAPLLRMLKKAAEDTCHEVVLPEMVLEEYLAHYRHDVDEAARAARKGIRDLQRLVARWPGNADFLRSLEDSAEQGLRTEITDMFRIHPVPAGAWREAMVREARRQPPAKTSWEERGSGARDVAVWLAVLDACAASTGQAYFVSDNSSDFGRRGALRPELAHEAQQRLGTRANMLTYCSDIPALMSHLGTAGAQVPSQDEIAGASLVTAAVTAALAEDSAQFELMEGIPNVTLKVVGNFSQPRDIEFERLTAETKAFQVSTDTWAFARGLWRGRISAWVFWKPELVPGSATGKNIDVSFTVEATIVMQLDATRTVTSADVTDRGRITVTDAGG